MGDLVYFKRQPRWWLLRVAPWPAVVLLIAVAMICILATDGPQVLRPFFFGQRPESAANQPSNSNAIVGRASVIDSDTIDIHGTRIRLHGIDAPESRQVCFVAKEGDALRATGRLCAGRQDRCEPRQLRAKGSGSLRTNVGGVPVRRRRFECLEGGARLGPGLPAIFPRLRRARKASVDRQGRHVGRQVCTALGLATGRAKCDGLKPPDIRLMP